MYGNKDVLYIQRGSWRWDCKLLLIYIHIINMDSFRREADHLPIGEKKFRAKDASWVDVETLSCFYEIRVECRCTLVSAAMA